MNLILEIPDELGAELGESFADLQHEVLTSLAARAYSKGIFSLEQVRQFLSQESRWEAQETLQDYGVWPGSTPESVAEDLQTLDSFLG